MINGYLKIEVLNIDEGDGLIQYQIYLSNGQTSTSQEFYGYEDDFKEFGAKLISFPKNINDKVTYELGENDKKFAYYLLIEIYCYEVSGQSAIKIIIDNHGSAPHYNKCEFFIKSIPASFNKFGKALSDWQPTVDNVFDWEFTD